MTKINGKVEELLAKHPHLSQQDAIKIVSDKNERKKQKRKEKADRINAKVSKKKSAAINLDEA